MPLTGVARHREALAIGSRLLGPRSASHRTIWSRRGCVHSASPSGALVVAMPGAPRSHALTLIRAASTLQLLADTYDCRADPR